MKDTRQNYTLVLRKMQHHIYVHGSSETVNGENETYITNKEQEHTETGGETEDKQEQF